MTSNNLQPEANPHDLGSPTPKGYTVTNANTSDSLQPEGDWEKDLTYIIEYNSWQKNKLSDFDVSLLTSFIRNLLAAEREKATDAMLTQRDGWIEEGEKRERTRCSKEIEGAGMVALYSEDYAQGFHAAIDRAIKIIRNEK